MIESDVSEDFADVGEVFLFDVSIVVFFVRPGASESDVVCFAVTDEMVVDEFRAVVGINGEEDKGHSLADLIQGSGNASLALAQHDSTLDPLGEDISDVECIGEFSACGKPAVRDQIDFDEARLLDIPEFSTDGNLMTQEKPWFCGAVEFFLEQDFFVTESSIDGGGRYFSQVLFCIFIEWETFFKSWEPEIK